MFKGEGKLDALIKVTGVGICGTDLPILQIPPVHSAKNGKISTFYLLVDLHESLASGEWPATNRQASDLFLGLTSRPSPTILLTNKYRKGWSRVSALGFKIIILILVNLLMVIIIIPEPTGRTPAAG